MCDERIISGLKDKTTKVWCLKTNTCIQTINAHSHTITGLQVLSDDQVSSCSINKTIMIMDLASANCLKKLQSEDLILSINVF